MLNKKSVAAALLIKMIKSHSGRARLTKLCIGSSPLATLGERPACSSCKNKRVAQYQGIMTVSTTWIMPLDCITSPIVTREVPPLASVRTRFLPTILTVSFPP